MPHTTENLEYTLTAGRKYLFTDDLAGSLHPCNYMAEEWRSLKKGRPTVSWDAARPMTRRTCKVG